MDFAPESRVAETDTELPTTEERNWAMIAHLSSLFSFLFPLGGVIAPLVVWLIKKEQSAFVAAHAFQSLVWNIIIAVIFVLLGIGTMILFVVGALFIIGPFLVIPLAMIAALALVAIWLIYVVLGAKAASEGKLFVYPLLNG